MQHLKKFNTMQLKPDWSYISNTVSDYKKELYTILQQCDHNPQWEKPTHCTHCKKKVKYNKIHQILGCPKYADNRKAILESLSVEIQHLEQTWHNKTGIQMDIVHEHTHEIIVDGNIIYDGNVQPEDQQFIMETLLGITINEQLPKKYQHQLKQILTAHLVLLISMTKQKTPVAIETTTIHYKGEQLHIYTEDLRKAKVIARTWKENQMLYRNIRDILDSLTLAQFSLYNIGLGSATSRTQRQKELAKIFTEKVILNANTIIIISDGSIHTNSTEALPRGDTEE